MRRCSWTASLGEPAADAFVEILLPSTSGCCWTAEIRELLDAAVVSVAPLTSDGEGKSCAPGLASCNSLAAARPAMAAWLVAALCSVDRCDACGMHVF